MTTQTEATQYIKATLTAFGPGEAISMTKETWSKLHEAMTALVAQPAQEPVAWALSHSRGIEFNSKYPMQSSRDEADRMARQHLGAVTVTPLYTSTPASKPLTDEEISDLWDGHVVPVFGKNGINPIVFARAIEAKLKEKNR